VEDEARRGWHMEEERDKARRRVHPIMADFALLFFSSSKGVQTQGARGREAWG